jgi:hypothetical protein
VYVCSVCVVCVVCACFPSFGNDLISKSSDIKKVKSVKK